MAKLASSFKTVDDPPHPDHSLQPGSKVIRFKLFARHEGGTHEWGETYEKEVADPEKWSRDIIAWFNRTLRPGEKKREFVRCEVFGEVAPAEHKWFKVTAMTKTMSGGPRHGQMYDAMECERCGVTGKRYGIQPHVKLDSKWRQQVYKRCDTAMEAMGRIKPMPKEIR